MTIPQVYLQRSIATADSAHLVLALYNGVLVAMDKAEEHLAEGAAQSLEQAHKELIRAQRIITELRVTLDHARGGAIAQSLDALYEFCLGRLVQANMEKRAGPLAGVRSTMEVLAGVWETACCQGAQQVHKQPAPVSA